MVSKQLILEDNIWLISKRMGIFLKTNLYFFHPCEVVGLVAVI